MRVCAYCTYINIHYIYVLRYNIFGLLWLTQFCVACQHMVLAGSVAGWYFARWDKQSINQPKKKIWSDLFNATKCFFLLLCTYAQAAQQTSPAEIKRLIWLILHVVIKTYLKKVIIISKNIFRDCQKKKN